MAADFKGKLVVAISSRALFNLDESHKVYEEEGLEAYAAFQRSNEHEFLAPGRAFPLVKKFLKLNEGCTEENARVEVLLLSKNTADTGLRIFNSIQHHGLQMTRAAFTGGKSPYVYAKAFGAHLFLSLCPEDVEHAVQAGVCAATIWSGPGAHIVEDSLNIAFDGDAVLFSDESEQVFKTQGLEAFNNNETMRKNQPLADGPFKGFMQALQVLQHQKDLPLPIRTALVTARGAPSHERVIRTLRKWNIRIDESIFLGGLEKVAFLTAFQADIFFDDQKQHCARAAHHLASAHVPYGVSNRKKAS